MTLGYSCVSATGRVNAGEVDTVWTPRTPRVGTYGVIFIPGSGNPRGYVDAVNQISSVKLAASLATAGIPCITCDFANQSWGNDTAVSRVDQLWAYLITRFPLMRRDKICLIAGSMGNTVMARYCISNPTKVAAAVGLIPLFDLVSFYNAYPGAVQNEISNAWGVANGAALPARANILANAAAAAPVPLLIGYSQADQTVLPAWSTKYCAAVGGTAIVTDNKFGHADPSIAGMPIPTVGKFITSYGA